MVPTLLLVMCAAPVLVGLERIVGVQPSAPDRRRPACFTDEARRTGPAGEQADNQGKDQQTASHRFSNFT